MKRSLFFVIALFTVTGMWVSSCTQNKPTGLIGPGRIQLTSTPTPAPDVNYTFMLHQEGTPVAGVQVTLLCNDKAISLKDETSETGEAVFNVKEFGTYTVSVDSFDGFKSQIFPVDPIGVTYTAIDYGIPRLEFTLMEGSELIPMHETQLKYKVTYRTKFERPIVVDTEAKNDIGVIFTVGLLKNDNDEADLVVVIPKSFERYNSSIPYNNLERQSYDFEARGTSLKGGTVVSNKRVLIRDWWFTFTGEYHFMAVYDDAERDFKMCFYTGIKVPRVEMTHNMPFASDNLRFETIEARTDDDLGGGRFIKRDATSAPGFTGYGWFDIMGRIETKASQEYAWKREQNGYMLVRITDGNNLNVIRKVRTDNRWGEGCYHSYCRQPWDSFKRLNLKCGTPLTSVSGGCFMGEYNITDVYRRRVERFGITIK